MQIKEIKYKDWYLNQDYIPKEDVDDPEDIRSFWEFHQDLCVNGFWLGGVYFPGYLYWHLNFWKVEVDTGIDVHGKPTQGYINPYFRDNEWIFFNSIYKAESEGKGLCLVGSRRLAKSSATASYFGHGGVFDKESQNIIAGLDSTDIRIMTDALDKGLNHLPEYWQWQKFGSWDKQITLGVEDDKRRRYPFSRYMIRNLDMGNKQERIAGTKPRKLLIDEALEENEKVLLDNYKWIPIKDVEVGQKVIDHNGLPTTVVRKIDVGVRDIYEFTLSDGRKIKSCDNHNWRVYNSWKKQEEIVTTKKIREKYFYEKYDKRYDKKNKSYNYGIPVNGSIGYEHKDLPIDPYWIGMWIGDGVSSNTGVCSIDADIIEYCKSYAKKLGCTCTLKKDSKKHKDFTYAYIVNKKGDLNPLIQKLKNLGVFQNKHIPDVYLKSSISQRQALLAGLLDTDGGIDHKGRVEFYTSNPVLKDNFTELLRGLGINFKIKEKVKTYTHKGEKKKGKLSYTFVILSNKCLFRTERKRKRFEEKISRDSKKRDFFVNYSSIINVEHKGLAQAYCIEVDNEDHLFLTTDYIVTKNCGKGPYLRGLAAALPGFTTSTGKLACSPIVLGTSGDMAAYEDLQKLFENPASMDFMEFPNEEAPDKPTGLFLGAKYRLEAKEDWKLGEFLLKHKTDPLINYISTVKWEELDLDELNKITIKVSNEEKAFKITDEKVEQRRLAGDIELYLKEQMYYPKRRADIFLKSSTNFFNKDAIEAQQARLKAKNIRGIPVELYHDGEKICWKKSEKNILTQYPVKTENKDAPILIYEFPEDIVPWGLNVAGIDSYRLTGDATYSTSLGAVVIYKRTKNVVGDGFRNTVVATYTARPNDKDYWNEQARLLIKFYNAQALVENDEYSFIDYMKGKGDDRFLSPQPAWLKAISIYTSQNRDFGVSRSARSTREFLDGLVKKELDDVVHRQYNDDGEVVQEMLGVSKINDYMLLEEIRLYEDGVNADRYVAFQLALAMARALDNVEGLNRDEQEKKEVATLYEQLKKSKNKLFSHNRKSSLLKPYRRR